MCWKTAKSDVIFKVQGVPANSVLILSKKLQFKDPLEIQDAIE